MRLVRERRERHQWAWYYPLGPNPTRTDKVINTAREKVSSLSLYPEAFIFVKLPENPLGILLNPKPTCREPTHYTQLPSPWNPNLRCLSWLRWQEKIHLLKWKIQKEWDVWSLSELAGTSAAGPLVTCWHCEWSFSAMRRIWYWWRATMHQEGTVKHRLSHMERDLTDQAKADEASHIVALR